MANARLRRTVKVSSIDIQTMRFLTNLEKRSHIFTMRLTDIEHSILQEEAREADVSMAEIVRARLWNRKSA